jgi:cytochrome b involved in lipid metabolism
LKPAFSFPTTINKMSRHQIISPAEIKRRVAEGEPVVIYEGYVLHLGEWIDMHPGGRLAILHMVGRDATDEINMSVIPNALRLALVYYLWSSLQRHLSPDRCGRG